MSKPVVYMAFPMTHNQSLASILQIVCRELQEEFPNVELFVPSFHTNPEECFETDYGKLKDSILYIGYVGRPSHGVGIEMALALCPLTLWAFEEDTLSPFVEGFLRFTGDRGVRKVVNSTGFKELVREELKGVVV